MAKLFSFSIAVQIDRTRLDEIAGYVYLIIKKNKKKIIKFEQVHKTSHLPFKEVWFLLNKRDIYLPYFLFVFILLKKGKARLLKNPLSYLDTMVIFEQSYYIIHSLSDSNNF